MPVFLKSFGKKKICIFNQSFSFKHKINKSNTEVYTHYWIVCLYSKNVCFNVIVNKFFNFFRNMFYSKIIKISKIIILTCKATQWVPISEYSSRFIIYAPSFISVKLCSGKLSREKTTLNLASFWYFCISKFVKGWGGIKNRFHYFYNQLLQFLPCSIYSMTFSCSIYSFSS